MTLFRVRRRFFGRFLGDDFAFGLDLILDGLESLRASA